ncbi:MAG: site-specific integrase [Xanthobacteraceae bacterium]
MRRLPKFVHGFIDRHGRPRFYFRRPGFESKALRGLPYSAAFMSDYEAAMAGQPLSPGANRTRPDSMMALALSYFASPDFRTLKPSTQRAYRWIIERLCKEHGDKRAAELRRDHIVKLMAARAETPGAANGLRMALRVLMKHAIDIGLRADDPTREVRAIRVRTAGHHSWTDEEIAQFERHHPIGSRARLALALLLYTGQRRGDVIRMGAQHIREASLHVKQQKTGVELIIPVHPNLAAIIEAAPRQHLTFVTTRHGGPFEGSSFSRWFRGQCDEAGLPHCSPHGLRKAAARRLAEAGCTAHEIGAITGHASLTELVRYTRAADQRHLAEAAMTKTRTSGGKPAERFAKKA